MEKLIFIKQQMDILHIPYAFMEWTAKIKYPYWVGEFSETPPETEDGCEESTFILTGTSRGSWLELMKAKEKIKRHFPTIGGLRAKTGSGAIAVFFSSSLPVPTGEADLKRLQVTLDIKEWKGT